MIHLAGDALKTYALGEIQKQYNDLNVKHNLEWEMLQNGICP
jgi:hypothetical protein